MTDAVSTLHPAAKCIYDRLMRAANDGVPAPRSHELALYAGIGGSLSSRLVAQMEADGLIAIERRYMARRFTIIATGKSTAWPFSVLHRDHAGAAPLPPRVDRDPCPRCNVRGDIGCVHQVRAWRPGDGVIAA